MTVTHGRLVKWPSLTPDATGHFFWSNTGRGRSSTVEKLFAAKIPAETVKTRAYRAQQKVGSNEPRDVTPEPETEKGGLRGGGQSLPGRLTETAQGTHILAYLIFSLACQELHETPLIQSQEAQKVDP